MLTVTLQHVAFLTPNSLFGAAGVERAPQIGERYSRNNAVNKGLERFAATYRISAAHCSGSDGNSGGVGGGGGGGGGGGNMPACAFGSKYPSFCSDAPRISYRKEFRPQEDADDKAWERMAKMKHEL
jgi:hypothetical protein